MITKITNTYATNWKRGAPDPVGMKLAVMGGIFHMASTDSNPQHKYCPEGSESYCSYNRAIANEAPPPKHNPTFSNEVLKEIFPTVKRLTEPDLLKRCGKMLTQNANESYNAGVWRRAPKTEFRSMMNIETAVALATLSFNCGPYGITRVMEELGLRYSPNLNKHVVRKALEAVKRSKSKAKGVSKWKRRTIKILNRKKEHNLTEKEGTTYSRGAFNIV